MGGDFPVTALDFYAPNEAVRSFHVRHPREFPSASWGRFVDDDDQVIYFQRLFRLLPFVSLVEECLVLGKEQLPASADSCLCALPRGPQRLRFVDVALRNDGGGGVRVRGRIQDMGRSQRFYVVR